MHADIPSRLLWIDDPQQLKALIRHHIFQAHQASQGWKLEAARLTNMYQDVGTRRTKFGESLTLRDFSDARAVHTSLAGLYLTALKGLHPGE